MDAHLAEDCTSNKFVGTLEHMVHVLCLFEQFAMKLVNIITFIIANIHAQ